MRKFFSNKVTKLFSRKKDDSASTSTAVEDDDNRTTVTRDPYVVRIPRLSIKDLPPVKTVWNAESATYGPAPVQRSESPTSDVSPPFKQMGFTSRAVTVKEDGQLLISGEDEMTRGSMTSIFTTVMGGQVDDLENVYVQHRDSIINEDGFISTPLHVVKTLVKKLNQDIHIEHYVLQSAGQKNKVYRVDILVGPLRGVGQCTRQQLARQLAAIDILEKLRSSDDGYRAAPFQKCGLLPGWRVDAMVYKVFHEVCVQNDLPSPTFTVKAPVENKLGKCLVICQIGEHQTKGHNDLPWLAKKLAAKKMYEFLTGCDFPLEATPTGNEVIGFTQMRLLGFQPKLSAVKRKWMMEHRITDTQVVVQDDEPDDDDEEIVEELEAEYQLLYGKRVKLGRMKEKLKITVQSDYKGNGADAEKARETQSSDSSSYSDTDSPITTRL